MAPPASAGETTAILRATLQHTRAPHYRRPGGPWDVPVLDTVLGRRTPAAVLVDGDLRLSGTELEHRVAATAGGLRARGVKRGDVVAWQLPNVWESVVLYRACWRLGAVAAPVHHQAGAADLDAMLSAVTPRLVLDGDDLADLVAGDPVEPGPVRASDVATVLFTSGSTGTPKAVLHTQRTLAYKARLMARVHGLHRGETVLMPAPMAHISGLLNGILVPGAASMRTVLMARWDPDEALRLVEREKVTFMIGPPTFFLGLMGAGSFSTERVRSLRLVSCGGAGVSPAFVAEASATLQCRIKRSYGSTEAPVVTTSTPADREERARLTDGRPVGEVEVRLGDGDELLVRGPELFAGYADRRQTNQAMSRGSWFHTGDLATIENGWVTIVGRIKDIVIRGGENISLSEVEAVLEAHPAVRQAVAVGEPDERMGERVAAAVVTSADFDLDECRRWFASQQVAKFKTPERVVRVDAVPVLAAGKPDRNAVKALIRDQA